MTDEHVEQQEHKITGERLLSTIKQWVHEGNVRRIIIKNDQGHTLIEIPLTLGVVGAVLAPVWVAIGAIGAAAAHFTVVIEKVKDT